MKAWTKTELPERAPPLPTLFATALPGAALRIMACKSGHGLQKRHELLR